VGVSEFFLINSEYKNRIRFWSHKTEILEGKKSNFSRQKTMGYLAELQGPNCAHYAGGFQDSFVKTLWNVSHGPDRIGSSNVSNVIYHLA
jgi:hypothetical protein